MGFHNVLLCLEWSVVSRGTPCLRRIGKISWVSQQSLHSLRHGDQCREDQADDKQHGCHQHRNQSKWTEAWDSHKLSVPGSIITDEGSKPEILARIRQITAAFARLKPVWNDKSISLSSKIRLMRSLVSSVFLYACESWTLAAELQRRIQAMEMRCYRKILHISYKDHVTNKEVRAKIQKVIGPHEDLLTKI